MIYFAQAGVAGPVKIGFSTSVERRLQSLQTASPTPLKILGVIDGDWRVERALHGRFAAFRLGGEWFSPHPDIVGYSFMPWKPEIPQPKSPNPKTAMDYIRRVVLCLSQGDFAKAIDVDQPTVSRWETEKLQPRRHQMIRIRDLALERGIAWEDRWFFAIPTESPASLSSPDAG